MFLNECTACGREQLIFLSQVSAYEPSASQRDIDGMTHPSWVRGRNRPGSPQCGRVHAASAARFADAA